jgi:hypothetical protein
MRGLVPLSLLECMLMWWIAHACWHGMMLLPLCTLALSLPSFVVAQTSKGVSALWIYINFFCPPSTPCSMHTLQSSYPRVFNNSKDPMHSLHRVSSRVFNNFEDPSVFVIVLVCPPGTFTSKIKWFSDTNSLHWLHKVSTLCRALLALT